MADYTVGELKRLLAGLPDETKISIAGDLHIYRLKRIADDEVFLEFGEFEAELSPQFRKRFPEVKVAFCGHESSGEVVQEVSVPRL